MWPSCLHKFSSSVIRRTITDIVFTIYANRLNIIVLHKRLNLQAP